MLRRTLEVAGDGQYLSVDRGFFVVRKGDEVRGRIPLADIGALIGNAHGLVYTANALIALATRGAPTVVCGSNHNPVAVVWPVDQHYEQAARFSAQVEATLPTRKRLWRQIIQRKIIEQAALLKALGKRFLNLQRMVGRVKPGDPSNIEAQAAKHYWRALFGGEFRRDVDGDGLNSLLNYGYAVLRSAVARATVAAGLHPSIGLFHRNPRNTFQLVDDLMEPFRPSIDGMVYMLYKAGAREVDKEVKRQLASSLYRDRRMDAATTPLTRCIELTVASVCGALQDPRSAIAFPDPVDESFLNDSETESAKEEAVA
jgi:CRISPR-associated protein Cas1